MGWSRETLAVKSGVPAITTRQFETGQTDPKLTTVNKWRRTLEKAGVIFVDPNYEHGPGVILRDGKLR